jgi:hypothetical protein
MEPDFFGTEQVTEEDRAYRGSRFSEVRAALFANPYQRIWGAASEPPIPIYDVEPGGRDAGGAANRPHAPLFRGMKSSVAAAQRSAWLAAT